MKKFKKFCILACAFLMIGALSGCAKASVPEEPQVEEQPQETTAPVSSESAGIPYRFASASEGIELRMANTDYFENMTQNDLDYRVGKQGATLEEMKFLAREQGDEFTDAEKQGVEETMARIEERFQEIGFDYPSDLEIVFVKNKMKDEYGAVAYTHQNQIYLEGDNLDFMISIPGMLDGTIAHELFHILSRNDPEFRQEMYAILGFTIAQEPEFSPEIRAILASNPDVEAFDSYAMFDINGQQTKCAVVTLLKTPYREGAYLVDNFSTGIVPYDAPDTYYTIDQVSNFWDVFGENSNYVIAAEEGIADNFASAVVYGMDGREYKNPEIIQSMLDVMAKR